jgi:ATP-dependent helicase HrpB
VHLSPQSWLSRAGDLPVTTTLDELASALSANSAVILVAPPGAGKTTVVPLSLADSPWLGGKRIIMLEPRRVAARAAARRMSWLLNERVGTSVGFRVRNETRVGPKTRIEVVTEGVLTRMLHEDSALEDFGLVIFDEFHERTLQGDLGLALTLQTQALLREDLRILVMSATLDVDAVSRVLGGAPVVQSEGRSFPVDVKYTPARTGQGLDGAVLMTVRRALVQHSGDILVFLPGIGEINQVARGLGAVEEAMGAAVHILHSSTPAEAQDAAISPSSDGRRKIVLASSIAETSITIDGVVVVVDSGFARAPKFSPRTGLTRLETVRVSRASAQQRAGRAGRTAPGVCFRIWNEHDQQSLPERAQPEILEADLAPLSLELAAAGVADTGVLRWINPPPAAALSTARQLLAQLQALDERGNITRHGREMSRLALHPRLAHMVLKSRELRLLPLACDVAALLGERDVVRTTKSGEDVDLRSRVAQLNKFRKQGDASAVAPANVDRAALERVSREAAQLRKATRANELPGDERATGLLLALAYPDRVALRRDKVSSRFLMVNGTGAALPMSQALSASEMIVVADLDGRKPESRIWLAAPVDAEDIVAHFGDLIEKSSLHTWDDNTNSVRLLQRERLGALVLREASAPPVDLVEAAQILSARVAEARLAPLPWTAAARAAQERVAFLRAHGADIADISDAALLRDAGEWLPAQLHGRTSWSDLKSVDLFALLMAMIGWKKKAELDELAPTHIVVPTGSAISVDYSDPQAPMLAVRLQELFGLAATPRVMGGKVAVTIQMLSPAGRPVQVTRDLAGFWSTSYFEVRKEMRGRYPKHEWPEKPMEAKATRRAKGRK